MTPFGGTELRTAVAVFTFDMKVVYVKIPQFALFFACSNKPFRQLSVLELNAVQNKTVKRITYLKLKI